MKLNDLGGEVHLTNREKIKLFKLTRGKRDNSTQVHLEEVFRDIIRSSVNSPFQ